MSESAKAYKSQDQLVIEGLTFKIREHEQKEAELNKKIAELEAKVKDLTQSVNVAVGMW